MKQKVVISPDVEARHGAFIRQLPDTFHNLGETIYKARNEIKVIEHAGEQLNVKKYAISHLVNRFVYRTIRQPKAVRAYRYALLLWALDIRTPYPLGYILELAPLHLGHSYLVTYQEPLRRTMYEFGEGGIKGRETIVQAFAHFTADMHKKGVYHLDYSPGNILFDQDDQGEWHFSIVDINRMRFQKVSLEMGCQNFARLWGDTDFLTLLAESYAEAIGLPEATPHITRRIIHHHTRFWDRYKD